VGLTSFDEDEVIQVDQVESEPAGAPAG
jgi:hypothetical protein